jgi:hypothetical protein
MKHKEVISYAAGAFLAALVAITVTLSPHGALGGSDIPVPILSGAALPAMMNSPDTRCGPRHCSDLEFNNMVDGLRAQWAITPEWIRDNCVTDATLPSMERCIQKQTESWMAENSNRQAPWLNPENVGTIAARIGN